MNDILAIARRMIERAEKPGVNDLDREDFLDAAAALRTLHQMLNARPREEAARQ